MFSAPFVASRLCVRRPSRGRIVETVPPLDCAHPENILATVGVTAAQFFSIIVCHVFPLCVAIRYTGPQVKVKCIQVRLNTFFFPEKWEKKTQQSITTTLQDFWRTKICLLSPLGEKREKMIWSTYLLVLVGLHFL